MQNSDDCDRCYHLQQQVFVLQLQLFLDSALVLAAKLHLKAKLNLDLSLRICFHLRLSFVLQSFPQSPIDPSELQVVRLVSYLLILPSIQQIGALASFQ